MIYTQRLRKHAFLTHDVHHTKAHTSLRLFCSGVPVISNRNLEGTFCAKICVNFDSEFFILWPSSTIMYSHSVREMNPLSFITYSNVVSMTLNGRFATSICRARRSTLLPAYTILTTVGVHVSNSRRQLLIVDRGATIRKGPCVSLLSMRYAIRATT